MRNITGLRPSVNSSFQPHTHSQSLVYEVSQVQRMCLFIFIFEYYPRLFAEDVLRYMPITTSIVLQIQNPNVCEYSQTLGFLV